jgi:hypothetical protein
MKQEMDIGKVGEESLAAAYRRVRAERGTK